MCYVIGLIATNSPASSNHDSQYVSGLRFFGMQLCKHIAWSTSNDCSVELGHVISGLSQGNFHVVSNDPALMDVMKDLDPIASKPEWHLIDFLFFEKIMFRLSVISRS